MDLPQELVEAIVSEVADNDKESLKAFSLTASAFRGPSQRALWHRLNISIGASADSIPRLQPIQGFVSVSNVIRKLDETPFIARCVRTLALNGASGSSSEKWVVEQIAMLQRILERLDGVTTVNLFGMDASLAVLQILPAFCARCPNGHLQNLALARVRNIPPAIIFRIFSCTKRLFISSCDVASQAETLLPGTIPPSILTDLSLTKSSRVSALLALPASLLHLPVLESLQFILSLEPQSILCRACARTLQRLDLICFGMSDTEHGSTVTFPPDMPSLRAVKFSVAFTDLRSATWLPNTLSALLADTRAPQLVSIELNVVLSFRLPPPIREELLPHLDGLLVQHPARPVVLWTLGAPAIHWQHGLRLEVDHLEQQVRSGMPRADAEGRFRISLVRHKFTHSHHARWFNSFVHSSSL
ncbi:hypothetical protein C8F01DRAFT_1171298 [Mycena amicta]|nr:hypothetical protein C8F01DRAFT_1171298 [Mycena amicta]